MPKPEGAPYELDGMTDRYLHLFGDHYGFLVYGKHRFDTYDFTVRFPDQIILSSALARYALFAMRPRPLQQPDDVAEDILNVKHSFNLHFKAGAAGRVVVTHEDLSRKVAETKFGTELTTGEVRRFGTLSDGVTPPDAYSLIESVLATIEEL